MLQRALQGLAAALVVAALLLGPRLLEPPAPTAAIEEAEPPRYELADARWVRLDEHGQPEFSVVADSIQYYKDESVRMTGLTLDTPPGPRGPWHVEAQAGRAPPREQRILLTGDVRAQGDLAAQGPVTLHTQELWVDQLRRELRTEEPVTIEGPGRKAQAVGMRADFNGERMLLLRDVEVTYVPNP